jgi:hypothetical protein
MPNSNVRNIDGEFLIRERILHLLRRLQTYCPTAARVELQKLRIDLKQQRLSDAWLPQELNRQTRLEQGDTPKVPYVAPGPKKPRSLCQSHQRLIQFDTYIMPICEECGHPAGRRAWLPGLYRP